MTSDVAGYTDIEQEAIILSAVNGMINEMVNHAIFCPLGETRKDIHLIPQTSETLKQFGILLRDFLSPVTSKGKQPLPFNLPRPDNEENLVDYTSLFYLRGVCEKPKIGTNIQSLRQVVENFSAWLEEYAFVENVWFASIQIEVDLRIKRIDFIRMSGDIAKHNFLRLGGQAKRLRKILLENDVNINESDAYLALPDCWDWFHTHLLAYHSSHIAEFLNEIRYSIYEYIKPIAVHRYIENGSLDGIIKRYTFDRPHDIINKFAWVQYFDLLQSSLNEPNYPRFTVSESFKNQF